MSDDLPSLENLSKALASLELAIQQPLNEFSRDSVIQRFEYTLEMSWKTLKRFLSFSGIDAATPRDVIRLSAQAGWIQDPTLWMTFIAARNLTSHTYKEEVAIKVYDIAIRLPKEVHLCLEHLHKIKPSA